MCLFGKKAGKTRKHDPNDPFGLKRRREEAVITVSNVKVGDRFHRRWSELIGDRYYRVVADYTVTRIEGDLITLESPREKPIQLTKWEFIDRLGSDMSDFSKKE